MHPTSDEEERKLSILDALQGDGAAHASHITDRADHLNAAELLQRLDEVFAPKPQSDMAKQEFEAYIQQPTQDVMAYMANKQRLFNQGWPHGMKEIEQQSFDMRTINIRISHDHNLSIAKF